MTKIISPKFLTNAPSGEDLFKNKSQDKIAHLVRTFFSKDFQLVKRRVIKNQL